MRFYIVSFWNKNGLDPTSERGPGLFSFSDQLTNE